MEIQKLINSLRSVKIKKLIVTINDYQKLNDQIFWQDQNKC